ncbi:hypothetical protein AB0H76_29010 [Nocardia sp. NPDC050712]|uniref:hypothetical protein n=1 Tax=Nocardia sp. NPDC050712 TaxID=3155518 RepID=UPI0033E32CA2
MSVTATRILAGAFAAATALTLALPAATAAPAAQSDTCADLQKALDRAERQLRITSNSNQQSILEFRIRGLESKLRDNNC